MLVDKKPDVCGVGLAYIGLPTAAVIARSGCKVLGVDVNAGVVDTINRGEIHIEEVDLDGMVQDAVSRKNVTHRGTIIALWRYCSSSRRQPLGEFGGDTLQIHPLFFPADNC